jgi:putative ATP-dependent endonuclease of the OLD family
VADWEGIAAWLLHLETFDIFFSSPLDLDFMMLQTFPEEYHATANDGAGPQIPAEPQAYAHAFFGRAGQS